MSLTNPNLSVVVRKQIQFKMKSCIGMFSTLVILQLLALLFSLGGSGMLGGSRSMVSYEINYYSIDIIVVFTILWAFINAILIKTKAYREDDFVFVTNRVSSNLSNIVFLLIGSIVGGITAVLSGYLLRIAIYFLFDDNQQIIYSSGYNLMDLVVGTIAMILLIFLFSSFGYIIGTLVHLHKAFTYIVPVSILGFIFLFEVSTEFHVLMEIGSFYFGEDSFWLFGGKAIITLALFFAGSMMISNRLEVRQ